MGIMKRLGIGALLGGISAIPLGAIMYVVGGAGAFLDGVSPEVFGTIGVGCGIMLGLAWATYKMFEDEL